MVGKNDPAEWRSRFYTSRNFTGKTCEIFHGDFMKFHAEYSMECPQNYLHGIPWSSIERDNARNNAGSTQARNTMHRTV